MFFKIGWMVIILNSHLILSESIPNSETNETNTNDSITSELDSELYLQEESSKIVELNITVYPRNCAEATAIFNKSGIYEIQVPRSSRGPFRVFCDATTRGGGWTVFLNRFDGSENFYRSWYTYKRGFGNLDAEFFLGLDNIHALTADYSQELLVVLEDFNGIEAYEIYDRFGISDEFEHFSLNTLGRASGNAGDSLSYHKNMPFSTFDRDNDRWIKGNCAQRDTGAWWYDTCRKSNLAGSYNDNFHNKGVNWDTFRGNAYSLRKATMMIRPRN